jgi:hypothetical protein
MADPLKIIRRLEAVTTDYAVFERDQVLTEGQLNSVVDYLDDQSRLTRTQLLGIGIVGGLQVALAKGVIRVGKGVGVTSDGDLLGLPADTVFDRLIDYDESAPAYEPFYQGEKRLPLRELLAADDSRDGKPLAESGVALEKMVVVAFMESYENDPDLCTGGDCDNRGRTARNTRRFLLLDREMAEKSGLTAALSTGADIAGLLPRVFAARADLGTGAGGKVTINSAEAFAAVYRSAASTTLLALIDALGALNKAVGQGWPEDLPSPAGWAAQLRDINGSLAGVRLGVQYYHAFAKDLVATWGELREALFADDSVLCPAAEAFPKHLLLGALAEPARLRTGRYPAPWLVDSAERERVRYLLEKFAALVSNFALPTDTPAPKIIPSRRESAPLEQRAVPIYYRSRGPLRALWHEARRQRGESDDNPGYFWMPTPDKNAADDPFRRDLGACDFFRIEGHLGMRAELAEPAIETLIRQRNLPIAVVSVLLHNQRQFVVRGPKFKKNSLHSLHYLLRQDLASQLKDNIAFSGDLIADIRQAGSAVQKPGGTVLNADMVRQMEGARSKLQTVNDELIGSGGKVGPLSVRSYKAFAQQPATWTARLDDAVVTTTKAKANLGDIMRTDVMSPVDSFSGSKTHLWVNWLGDILKKREDDEKDRLLFSKMIAGHPGLEHTGGAVPGGTFVLAYDDSGVVIGDLMLPYWLDDNDEGDQEEPELTLPDIRARLPEGLLPIKVIRPFELALDDFRVSKILPEVKLQENYATFFRESLGSLGEVIKNTRTATVADATGGKAVTNDRYMEQMLAIVKGQQEQIKGLREVAGDDRLPAATRDQAQAQIRQMEEQLAVSVSTTVEYFAVAAPETVRFEADKAAVYETVGQAVNLVTDKEVSSRLQSNLKQTAIDAGKQPAGSSALVASQLMNKVGIGIG